MKECVHEGMHACKEHIWSVSVSAPSWRTCIENGQMGDTVGFGSHVASATAPGLCHRQSTSEWVGGAGPRNPVYKRGCGWDWSQGCSLPTPWPKELTF